MKPMTIPRTALFVLLMAAIAVCADKTPPTYQKGTIITKESPGKSYELKGPDTIYRISDCGDFQTGQAVEYRAQDGKIYIRRENSEEDKCKARVSESVTAPTYQQGTITGWNTRVDTSTGGWGSGTGTVFSSKRRTKVYELKGAGMVYQIDDCGSFQAGQFTAGQAVEYRVDDSNKYDRRIYLRRDNGKEYSCRMEGARAVEGTKAEAPSTAQQ